MQPGILARASPTTLLRMFVLMTASAFMMTLTRAEGEGKQAFESWRVMMLTFFALF